MNDLLDFVRTYWKLIAVVVLFLMEVLILILKKKPVKEIVDNSLIAKLCKWIAEAENLVIPSGVDKGKYKLNYVVSKAFDEYENTYTYNDLVSIIEWLLTLPQKKDV